MNKKARRSYNQKWTSAQYENIKQYFQKEYPDQLGFRISESPIFLDKDFKEKVLSAGEAIIDQLLAISEEVYRSRVPAICDVPNCPPRPQMLSIDFGICEEDGVYVPKLIELQAFPSLFFYQLELGLQYLKFMDLPENDGFLFHNNSIDDFVEHMRRLVVGTYDVDNVVLLELYPHQQKTKIDFVLTQKYLGIEIVCLTDIVKKGRKLYYKKDGQEIVIHRIYNRIILDELDRYKHIAFPFSFNDELDVEWCTHPEWYFRVSKCLLPILTGDAIPEAYFLNKMPDELSLDNFVLKPLYSFSGTGINIHPTKADIDQITDPENYILQRKVQYAAIFEDLDGTKAKAEIRILYIWQAGEHRPIPAINLVRMTKSEMINIDHNKANLSFTGSSIALWV